jgi:hypothetical protein
MDDYTRTEPAPEALIEPLAETENPVVDTSVQPIAPAAPTEGETMIADEAPETAAAFDAVGEHLMARGGEGGMPLAAAVVETALAAPAQGERNVNFRAHPPVATAAEAAAHVATLPAGSFFKKTTASHAAPYRVYEAI